MLSFLGEDLSFVICSHPRLSILAESLKIIVPLDSPEFPLDKFALPLDKISMWPRWALAPYQGRLNMKN